MTDFQYLNGHPPACTCANCTKTKNRKWTQTSSYKDISWEELKRFLWNDKTDEMKYIPGVFVCEDFTRTLQRNAKVAGIECSVVYLDIIGCEGHMCNAFYTRDKGRVYIDCTASQGDNLSNNDKVVNIKIGDQYAPEFIFPTKGYSKFLPPLGIVTRIDVI
jgi:hypothetical protein